MRTPRHLITALAMLATGTVVGVTVQQSVSAVVSTGDRPVLIQITPCRVADTRSGANNVGPKSSPLGAAGTMSVSAQQAGTDCAGKIPAGATALSLNVTALNATSTSFITVWADGARPEASALNPTAGQRVFNAVTAELAAGQTFQVYNNRGNVDVFIDINGYYEDHNHDDRYLTEAEVDAKVAAGGTTAGTFSVGTASFDAWESQFGWAKNLDPTLGKGGGAWITSNPHGGVVPGLAAPVQLPDGATVTEVTAYFTDTSAISALALDLRCAEFDGDVTIVAVGSSTSAAASSSGQVDLAINPAIAKVDNSRCSYFFYAGSGSWGSEQENLKIIGASITTI